MVDEYQQAKILASQGDWQAASGILANLITNSPPNPDYYCLLGVALANLGALEVSQRMIVAAANLRPGDPDIERALAELRQQRKELNNIRLYEILAPVEFGHKSLIDSLVELASIAWVPDNKRIVVKDQ